MPKKMELLLAQLGKKIEHEKDIFAHLLAQPWGDTFTCLPKRRNTYLNRFVPRRRTN